jgi:hypothetical protein
VNHEIANKSKEQIDRKLTLEWYASLVECCLLRHGLEVFSFGARGEDVK